MAGIGFTWNAVAGRFIAPSGRFVSLVEVRAALDRAIIVAATKGDGIAKLLESGTIGVLEFERLMRVLIKDTQIYAGAVASGGFSNIDVTALATLSNNIGVQFAYLADWAQNMSDRIDEGETAIVAGKQAAARAAMYAKSARNTFDTIFRAGQLARGYTEELSVLHPAEHCAQCVDMASIGWVLIGTIIPIGERECLSNCRCTVSYR
jgi:hypothetical protein